MMSNNPIIMVFGSLPLAKKYPNAPKELGWHYLFPSKNLSIDPDSQLLRRHHINETVFA